MSENHFPSDHDFDRKSFKFSRVFRFCQLATSQHQHSRRNFASNPQRPQKFRAENRLVDGERNFGARKDRREYFRAGVEGQSEGFDKYLQKLENDRKFSGLSQHDHLLRHQHQNYDARDGCEAVSRVGYWKVYLKLTLKF